MDMIGNLWFRMRGGVVKKQYTMQQPLQVHDWTFDPSNRGVHYVCNTGRNEVISISHMPIGTFTEQFLFSTPRPTSIRCLTDGTKGVVGGQIAKPLSNYFAVYPPGQLTPSVTVTIPHAFYLDYDEFENFVVACLDGSVFRVTPAGTMTQIRTAGQNGIGMQTWVTISVDRKGTCGPVGEMLLAGMHMYQNASLEMFRQGVWVNASTNFANGSGQATTGLTQWCVDLFGHYIWSAEYSPTSCEVYFEGASDLQGSIVAGKSPNLPPQPAYDHASFVAGRTIAEYGCGPGTLYGSVPTFTCQMSDQGYGYLGVTPNYLANMTFVQQEAFVAQGMLGFFPRPYLKGRDMYRFLYFMNYSSHKLFTVGKPHFDALLAYCTPSFGQELPAITQPQNSYVGIGDPATNFYIHCIPASGSVTLQARNEYESVKTGWETTALFNVWLNEGLVGAVNLGTVALNGSVPLPTLPTGQYSLRAVFASGSTTPDRYRGKASILVI
jgi:hypothetical protein